MSIFRPGKYHLDALRAESDNNGEKAKKLANTSPEAFNEVGPETPKVQGSYDKRILAENKNSPPHGEE
mgnify:CR=1 FL=1